MHAYRLVFLQQHRQRMIVEFALVKRIQCHFNELSNVVFISLTCEENQLVEEEQVVRRSPSLQTKTM